MGLNLYLNISALAASFLLLAILYSSPSSATLEENSELIVSRFQQYLQINTAQPNPNYKQAVRFILSQAESIGLPAQILEFVKDKPVVLLTWQGKQESLPSILFNSHTDVVPAEENKWSHGPFSAHRDSKGDIYARGSQDMKCVSVQYLEALRNLKKRGFVPLRTIHVSFVPDEEIGGRDGAGMLVSSEDFQRLNVGVVLDEGLASPDESYRVFYGERSPWWLTIKAVGAPAHGSKLYDNSAMENLLKSIESISRYRASQFDIVKAGLAAEGDVTSVNPVFMKAGTPTPTGFVMNLQPSEAEAGFDIRVSPGTNAEGMVYLRQKEDPWNSIAAGAATGGFLQMRQGMGSATRSAIFGGILLALIEGAGILMNKMLAPPPPPKLEEQFPPMGIGFPGRGVPLPAGAAYTGGIPGTNQMNPTQQQGGSTMGEFSKDSTSGMSSELVGHEERGDHNEGFFSGWFGKKKTQEPKSENLDIFDSSAAPPVPNFDSK